MEPVIINKDEMLLVGAVSVGGSIDELWARFDQLSAQITQQVPNAWYEVHTFADDPQSTEPEYFAGVEVTGVEAVPVGAVVKRLQAGQYAVFTHRLANGGYAGLNATMESWLANGEYQLAPNLSVQLFDAVRFKGSNHPDSEIDFLLPVVPKTSY